jgi:hypothetical protein
MKYLHIQSAAWERLPAGNGYLPGTVTCRDLLPAGNVYLQETVEKVVISREVYLKLLNTPDAEYKTSVY